LKIAYDYQIFSAQQYGGISRYYVEVAKYLSLSDYSSVCDIKVVAPLYINNYLANHSDKISTIGIHIPKTKVAHVSVNLWTYF